MAALESVNAELETLAEGEPLDVRTEGGAVRAALRGALLLKGEIPLFAAGKLFVLPAAMRPKKAVFLSVFVQTSEGTGFAQRLVILSNGEAGLGATLHAGNLLFLDGVTWPLT